MSPELPNQIRIELEQIERLFEEYHTDIQQAIAGPPNRGVRSSLAILLHSLYTGIENVFKRIARECDGGLPSGAAWHRDLLDTMAKPVPPRPAVISESTRRDLRSYLGFRHVFRQAYGYELHWEKMADLVADCEGVWRHVREDLTEFVAWVEGQS